MEISDFEELEFLEIKLPARLWKVLHDSSLQMLVVVCRNVMPERPQLLAIGQFDNDPQTLPFPSEIPNWAEVMAAENGRLFMHQFAGEKDPTLEGTWVWNWTASSPPQFFTNQVFSSIQTDESVFINPLKEDSEQLHNRIIGHFSSYNLPEYYVKDSPYFESIIQIILQHQPETTVNTQSFGYFELEAGFVLGWRTEDNVIHFATQHSGQADHKMVFKSFEGEKNVLASFWFVLTNLGICFASGPQNLIFAHQ